MYQYKGISFAKELNCSLANFKKMFASNKHFLGVPHLDRDAELEKVWKAVMKFNGNDTKPNRKSKSTTTKKG